MAPIPVTCPSCKKEVSAEVMQVGIVAVMATCPACGEGPAPIELPEAINPLETLGEVVFLHLSAPTVERLVEVMRLIDEEYEALDAAAAAERVRDELTEDGHLMAMFPRESVDEFAAMLAIDFPDVRIVDQTDFPVGLFAGAMQAAKPTITVDAENDAMNDAMARARAEIGRFVARLGAPQPGDANFAVKAPLREDGRTEHVWLSDVRAENGSFVGTVANEPVEVTVAKMGDEWRVAATDISDWAFDSGDRMHGHYTLRAMLPYFPPEARTELEGRLAPLP